MRSTERAGVAALPARADRVASLPRAPRGAALVAIGVAALVAAAGDAIAVTLVDDAGHSFDLARPPRRIV